jgi:TrmH family RNA methyltransferase
MLSKAQIKYIRSLRDKKYRQKFRQFVVEGGKVVSEFVGSTTSPLKEIYATREWMDTHPLVEFAKGTEVLGVSTHEMEQMTAFTSPPQVLAVADLPEESPLPDLHGQVTLVLDEIQDPGNMGTLVRTAEWFGIHTLLYSPRCADPFGPKSVQSSMGSICAVILFEADPEFILQQYQDIPSYATVLDGKDIHDVEPTKEGLIIIGNESRGLSPELLKNCTHRVSILGKGRAQSLNAAVAAGIICARLTGTI